MPVGSDPLEDQENLDEEDAPEEVCECGHVESSHRRGGGCKKRHCYCPKFDKREQLR